MWKNGPFVHRGNIRGMMGGNIDLPSNVSSIWTMLLAKLVGIARVRSERKDYE